MGYNVSLSQIGTVFDFPSVVGNAKYQEFDHDLGTE